MNLSLLLLTLTLCLILSAVFSGSETGFYSLSRVKLDADVRAGRRNARLVDRLTRDERGLLITILIGNNLMLELVTTLGDDALGRVSEVPVELREVVLTVILTPMIFFAGELIPKDLFRYRPHSLLGLCAPVIGAARVVFWPLSLLLRGVGVALERTIGIRERGIQQVFGRESVLSLLDEGARAGTVAPHAQVLAQNVLELRSIPVERVMVPWDEVQTVRSDAATGEALDRVRASSFTRLPLVGEDGRCESYLHQLDVLEAADSNAADSEGEAAGLSPERLEALGRSLPSLDPGLSVDRALSRMRLGGLRMALVGDPASPRGVVSLKDLVERIAGDLADW
ncbi:MAG: CNNM domain-containing protein [Planctomycetota bacterium]|jgi:CBS domain containing-hemolysin-like protein